MLTEPGEPTAAGGRPVVSHHEATACCRTRLREDHPELPAAMNASNGALAATLATDDRVTCERLALQIRAFKAGHGAPRSRGDREELFGGFGASWRGAFVGGELLVRAVTRGPAGERLPGDFPEYHLMPSAA